MPVPRSLVALQRSLGAEVRSAAGALSRLVGQIAAKLLTLESADHEEVLVEATVNRVMGAADLAGRIELRFGATATDPAAAAPAGELATPEAARKALRELREVHAEVTAELDRGPSWKPRAALADAPIPPVPFADAIRDLRSRDPIGAADLLRLGLTVSEVYGPVETPSGPRYPHAFAAAKAVTRETAAAVQRDLVAGRVTGTPTRALAAKIARDWDWPESYARNVARTNYATSSTAGRFAEAERLQAHGTRIGFRFDATLDSDVRPGHRAMDGVTASADDPVWDSWSPPLGYQCRCVLVPLVGEDVPEGRARVPAGAEKTPGFGARPPRPTAAGSRPRG